MIDIAELGIEDRQTLEIAADRQLIGHTHAAMDLDRFLTNMVRSLTDADFGG